MTTELELIYTIWDVVSAGQTNSDDPINERLMRQFLRIHRGKSLEQYYRKGNSIPDEVFQNIGPINFYLRNGVWITDKLPKIIRLESGMFGLMLEKDGYTIPVMNSEEFSNAKRDRFNKYHPKTKFINNKLTLDLGQKQLCNDSIDGNSNSFLNSTVKTLHSESLDADVKIDCQVILVNPDDDIHYDWTSTPYPMSDELIENLINSVNAREFNIFLKMRSDETGDMQKNDSNFNQRETI